jgi:DNA ligase-1
MADIPVGETVEMKGSGAKPYRIKNCGVGGWSCTCPAWRNQSLDPRVRTCKHIIKLRGEEAEKLRIGSAADMPSRKPEGETADAPKILLADPWDGESNVAGWWMSEKLDGVRAFWDGKRFFSRKGNLFLAPDYFVAGLPSVPLDGELWITRRQFNKASGIAKTDPSNPEWRELRFVVFDVPAHGGEFEARLRYLNNLLGNNRSQFASVLEQTQCRDMDHLRAELERVESLGGEGLMLRQPGSKYVEGRSSSLLKVKTFHTAEATVIGHDPGEGRHLGRLGALRARLNDGSKVEFGIGTGLSDEDRRNPPPIGTVITFKYQELNEYGTPRFTSYVGVRHDATASPVAKSAPAASSLKKPEAPRVVVPAAPPPAAKPDEVRRYQYDDGGEVRFWEASRTGSTVRLTFGTVGGKTSSKEKTHASADAAKLAIHEALAEKLDDGFVEVDPVTHKSLAAAAKPAPVAAPAAKAAPAPAAASAGGKRRFEFSEGTSNKFWEISLSGKSHTVTFGRIGTEGQTKTKDFADEAAARKDYDKLVREKTGKGYQEVT